MLAFLPPRLTHPLKRAIVALVISWAIQWTTSQAATLVVTNLASTGPGTLQTLLTQAGNGDTITFAVAGTIYNSASELVISNDVSIIGPGSDAVTVTGATNVGPRVFRVLSGVTANLSGLTIRDSYAEGSGVYNEGNLSITNCTFLRCRSSFVGTFSGGGNPVTAFAGRHGGAIYSAGTLTAVNCNFLNCQSGPGGRPDTDRPDGVTGGPGGHGGAIYSSGTLLAVNCNFLTNAAAVGGYGGNGRIFQFPPYTTVGRPGGDGGNGGAVYATGPADFVGCAFGFNSAGTGGAGGSGVSRSSSSPGPGASGAAGGRGGNGGAVFSLGGATFTSCTFANNNAGPGGAGGNGGAAYNSFGGFGGAGGDGGHGVLYCPGSAELIACTLTTSSAGQGGNGGSGGAGSASGPGGNGGNGGTGGSGQAIYGNSTNALITLKNVLVAGNLSSSPSAAASGGSGGGAGSGTPPISTAGTNGAAGVGRDLFGAFASHGHNFVSIRTGSTGFTNNVMSDIVGTNTPLNASIAPLARNGGPTLTCAFNVPPVIPPGSPVFDAGDDAITTTPLNLTTDQRGYPRLAGPHVDIGAYEVQWAATPIFSSSATTNGTFFMTLTNVPGVTFLRVLRSSSPVGPWGSPVGSMSEIAPGQYQWSETTLTTQTQRFFEVRWP